MKRDWVSTLLLVFVGLCGLAAITVTIWVFSVVPIAKAASMPQWDYAVLYYLDKDSSVTWVEVDSTEQQQVRDSFTTFRTSLKIDAVPSIYYLNIAGRYGWELILERDASDGSSFTFKKAHE